MQDEDADFIEREFFRQIELDDIVQDLNKKRFNDKVEISDENDQVQSQDPCEQPKSIKVEG